MRKIFSTFLAITLAFTLNFTTSFATGGDPNIDSGGGGMGQGTSENKWSPGMDGVRVTIVNDESGSVVSTPIDLTNKEIPDTITHFGKVSKLSYSGNSTLSPSTSKYTYVNPQEPLPTIVTDSGSNNIEQIKSYFTDEQVIRGIANETGMDYDVLIAGKYKLMLEPIIYFTFEGTLIATTATEAALYDQQLDGGVRRRMVDLTHKNLPLSMFLEENDLGYNAWSGSTTSRVANEKIIESLGVGIVRFKELEPPEIEAYDYIYRTDTEVITSVFISGGQSDPDNPTYVSFEIDGKNYSVGNIYYPAGDGQYAWVKWHTPKEEQEMVINVSVAGVGGTDKSEIAVNIVDLDKNPPPNPLADDRNDDFEMSEIPEREEKTSASWVIWKPWWFENWVDNGRYHSSYYIDYNGNVQTYSYWVSKWEDEGWWMFDCLSYSASLRGDFELKNDSKNPTATTSSFKSGYGVRAEVESRASATQRSGITETPNAVAYFPEFNYDTYWRLLQRDKTGLSCEFSFKENHFSTYKNPTHFSPIWYPDGPYEVNVWLIDVWTPDGMLCMNLSDELMVDGDLWMDWHIGPLDPNR